jgi:1,4-alpha-glucan branching enzyme
MMSTGTFPVPPIKGGAIEKYTYSLVKQLERMDCQIHFVSDITSGTSFSENVTIHKVHSPTFSYQGGQAEWFLGMSLPGVLVFHSAMKAIKKFKFDVIHGQGSVSSALIFKATKGKIPTVFTVHGPTPWLFVSNSRFTQLMREIGYKQTSVKVYSYSTRIIVTNNRLKKELIVVWNVPARKISVIPPLGVDTSLFSPEINNADTTLKKHGLKLDYGLFVGRLTEQKNVELLIRAFKGTHGDLVIVGDGPQLGSLKHLSKRLGISNKVHFLGWLPINELRMIYSRASFFVIASKAEGFPVVALEAMSSQLPIIGTPSSGISEIVTNNVNGCIVEPCEEELQAKINNLFTNPTTCKAMGKHSREIAERSFSWLEIARRILDVYREAAEDFHS